MERPLSLKTYLDFEKPIAELESKVTELRALGRDQPGVSINDEIKKLEQKAEAALMDTYAKLTPWQKAQVARHPERPHALDYIAQLIEDFTPLAGDRYYAEDAAIVGGLGRFRGRSVMVIGNEKGSDTESRIRHNFGMAMPEGFRKAVRLMSTRRAPIPASAPRSAAKPRPSPARPTAALRSACRSSPSSSARAAPAARWRSPPPTASSCLSTRSTR